MLQNDILFEITILKNSFQYYQRKILTGKWQSKKTARKCEKSNGPWLDHEIDKILEKV